MEGPAHPEVAKAVEERNIFRFVKMLRSGDVDLLKSALAGIETVLERAAARGLCPDVIEELDSCGGVGCLEELQRHDNRDVFQAAAKILQTFVADEEDDEEDSPAQFHALSADKEPKFKQEPHDLDFVVIEDDVKVGSKRKAKQEQEPPAKPRRHRKGAQEEEGAASNTRAKRGKIQAKLTDFLPAGGDEANQPKPKTKTQNATTTAASSSNNTDPPNTTQRFFTCYWSPPELQAFAGVGPSGPCGIHITGGNAKRAAHSKLRGGDVYFPLTQHKGKLLVLGRLRVAHVTNPRDLAPAAFHAWHASRKLSVIGGCYASPLLLETVPERWAASPGREVGAAAVADLRWLKPSGEERALTDPENTRYVTAALMGVYRLAPASAELLTARLGPASAPP